MRPKLYANRVCSVPRGTATGGSSAAPGSHGLVPFHCDTLILKTRPTELRDRVAPRPMILVWEVIWLPRRSDPHDSCGRGRRKLKRK